MNPLDLLLKAQEKASERHQIISKEIEALNNCLLVSEDVVCRKSVEKLKEEEKYLFNLLEKIKEQIDKQSKG